MGFVPHTGGSWRIYGASCDSKESRSAGSWKLLFPISEKNDPGNYRAVGLALVRGKMMAKVILGVTEKHVEDDTVVGQSQRWVDEGKVKSSQPNVLL